MSSSLSSSNLFNVQGKWALVTGGGSGIGANMAETLITNGAKVIIASRKEPQLKEISDKLNKIAPGSCQYVAGVDVSTRKGCDALIAEVKKRTDRLHILINNSGTSWTSPFGDTPEPLGFDRVFGTNVKSIWYLTAGLASMLAEGADNIDPGRVINISSMAGVETKADAAGLGQPGTGMWSYMASKASVNSLTRTLAVTLGPRNITVNAILPGNFPSKLTAYGMSTRNDALISMQPSGRYGTPEDIGGLAMFLCSRGAAHITAALIPVDGGSLVAGRRVPGVVPPKL